MVFDKRASLLAVVETATGVYEWVEQKKLWVHMQRKNSSNLFSKVGIGAKTVLFTMRKTSGVSLFSALRVNGRFYFLTDIVDADPIQWEITAADIQPVTCSTDRTEPTIDEYKRRQFDESKDHVVTFPGILTEKYLGFEQQNPMGRLTTTFVLVTPKIIALEDRDLVTIGDDTFDVQVAHCLDEYKNEYEIIRREDT